MAQPSGMILRLLISLTLLTSMSKVRHKCRVECVKLCFQLHRCSAARCHLGTPSTTQRVRGTHMYKFNTELSSHSLQKSILGKEPLILKKILREFQKGKIGRLLTTSESERVSPRNKCAKILWRCKKFSNGNIYLMMKKNKRTQHKRLDIICSTSTHYVQSKTKWFRFFVLTNAYV